MKNIFYFKEICKIGGTEVFLWEIAKKYNDWDITIYYDKADPVQLNRLKKYLRCKKRKEGEVVKCDRAFYNFNIDMIEQVEAKEHVFVAHAIYQELGYEPPITHPKLNRWIAVSQYACDKIEEYARTLGRTDIKAELCYNPLTLEPKERLIRIICASRLDDETKGGNRTRILIEALDRYCNRIGRHYLFYIFSNPMSISINSPNVVIMQPRADIRPYIANVDYLAQLSNDMETFCYSIAEALEYGVPVITTPLTVCKELPIKDNMQLICNWDMSNVDEIVEKIFNNIVEPFQYKSPNDSWDKFLEKGKSTYMEEKDMRYKVRALNTYKELEAIDNELQRIPEEGEEFEVSKERLDVLLGDNEHKRAFVEKIEEIKEEPVKRATKKTSKK